MSLRGCEAPEATLAPAGTLPGTARQGRCAPGASAGECWCDRMDDMGTWISRSESQKNYSNTYPNWMRSLLHLAISHLIPVSLTRIGRNSTRQKKSLTSCAKVRARMPFTIWSFTNSTWPILSWKRTENYTAFALGISFI